MTKRFWWLPLFGVLGLLTAAAVLCNARLYTPSSVSYDEAHIRDDVLPQLRFLRTALDNGAGEEMQRLFPEGYFFTNMLYGLTWAEVGMRQGYGTPLHE